MHALILHLRAFYSVVVLINQLNLTLTINESLSVAYGSNRVSSLRALDEVNTHPPRARALRRCGSRARAHPLRPRY